MLVSLKQVLKNKFIKNASWLVFAQIYQMIIQLIVGVISARYLGPTNYGTLNYAAAYISFFTILCSLGLEGVVVREIVKNREQEGVILGTSIVYRLIASILSMVSVWIIVYIVNTNDRLLLTVVFLQSLVLPFNAFQTLEQWYQSNMNLKISTFIKCISYTIMILYKIFLLILNKSVKWFAFATSLDALLIAILLFLSYKKYKKQSLSFDFRVGNKLLSVSYHLILSSLMAVVYNQMDRLMIGRILGQREVGYYAAATTITHMWLFIPQAINTSAQPIIMELKNTDEKEYKKRIYQLTSGIFWIGIFFATMITICSDFIIGILYGGEYIKAKTPLMISVWGMVFSSLSYPRSIWLLCENKQMYTKKIMLWGVITNLVLNLMWISKYGIIGAAIATFITEITCCVISPLYYKKTREFPKNMIKLLLCIFKDLNKIGGKNRNV